MASRTVARNVSSESAQRLVRGREGNSCGRESPVALPAHRQMVSERVSNDLGEPVTFDIEGRPHRHCLELWNDVERALECNQTALSAGAGVSSTCSGFAVLVVCVDIIYIMRINKYLK